MNLRVMVKKVGWGATVILGAGGALGCSTEEEEIATGRKASVAAPVPLMVAADGVPGAALIVASEFVEVGDRVELGTPSSRGEVVLSGGGTLRVGTEAISGSLWSGGGVELRDRSTVAGTIHAKGSVQTGNQVTVSGAVVPGPWDGIRIPLSPPATSGAASAVSLEPNQEVSLPSGVYGALTVKAGATLRLEEGSYEFETVVLEPQSRLVVDSECGPQVVRVRGGFFFRGTIEESSGGVGLGLLVEVLSTQTVHIEAPFRGTVLAPRSEVVVNSSVHQGRFFGRSVRIHAGARVFAPTVGPFPPRCAGPVPPPSTGPAAVGSGSAPTLSAPSDVPSFVDWFMGIIPSQLDEASLALAPVATSTPIVNGFISELSQALAAGRTSRVSMLLELFRVLRTTESRATLLNLLGGALPPVAVSAHYEPPTAYEDAVLLRVEVLDVLRVQRDPGVDTAIELQLGASDTRIQAAAVQALMEGVAANEIEAFRQSLPPGVRRYVDLPVAGRDDFRVTMAAYMNQEN